MREILFRGKRVSDGKWVEGCYCKQYNSEPPHARDGIMHERLDGMVDYSTTEVARETIGQYIGLCDKNGKKIFEGDIMPVWEGGEKYLYKVIYCGDCFMLSMLDSEQGSYPLSVKHSISEIIGNIHDNPELMKGEQK